MTLNGYKKYAVRPFHTASGYTAIVTTSNLTVGTATANVTFASGTYDVAVNYYDLYGGKSKFQLDIGNRTVGQWVGNHEDTLGHVPSIYLDGHSATRITFKGVEVRQGDLVRLTGQADGTEPAPVDYLSFLPPGIVD
jgi:alpha-glucuronidase